MRKTKYVICSKIINLYTKKFDIKTAKTNLKFRSNSLRHFILKNIFNKIKYSHLLLNKLISKGLL